MEEKYNTLNITLKNYIYYNEMFDKSKIKYQTY